MSRAVLFDRAGPASVLYLAEVDPLQPGAGEVRIAVETVGLNPADYKLREGNHGSLSFPATLGRELSGVIEAVGDGVTRLSVGDAVFGTVADNALGELIVVSQDNLAPKPTALSWVVAGGLALAGQTAWDEFASQRVTDADTVLVSAAAGGVGTIVAQFAVRAGATVIGTASEAHHDLLRSRGIIPVTYGPGLADRVRAAAPGPVTVVFDHSGSETIEAALALGVPAARINTIAMDPSVHDVVRVGRGPADPATLERLAGLVVAGELAVDIAAVYPLEQIVAAFERLENGHLRGKVIVAIGAAARAN